MEHEKRYHGGPERLRSPERIARLEIERVVTLSLDGLAAASALDVGTGTGLFAEAFAAKGLAVAGIDPDAELLALAARLLPGVEFKEGTAEAIPYGDGSFDVVFLGQVLHETDDPAAALEEARRVSTGRVVVLEWPYIQEEQGPPIEHRLKDETIADLAARAGFGVVDRVRLTRMMLYRMSIELTKDRAFRERKR
jgi:ubiquinone/menaquinone biosynthesis C-methylase UbiE